MQSQIASILGRHGDTVTISIAGAGQVSLEVDGEGPDLDEITPEHDSAWRSGRLDFSFEVRDDDSGLRHDGELVRSADGDDTQVNGDRDQVTSGEPLTVRSGGQISVNGKAADISLRVGSICRTSRTSGAGRCSGTARASPTSSRRAGTTSTRAAT